MDESADDDLIVEMITNIATDVLERIGEDDEGRYQFFKAFVELAKKTVANVH